MRLRVLLALALLPVLPVAPSRAAAPFTFLRIALGTVAAPVERTFVVPPGALLAGVTWSRGAAAVSVRRGLGPWELLDVDADGRSGTEPAWLGTPVVTFRIVPVRSLAGVTVDFAGGETSASSSSATPQTRTMPRIGDVVTRAGWGADESLRRGSPTPTTPRAVVVHHTVTPNDYSREQAASYIRAVYAYHTRSRGWRDIGYNMLVDRFGTVYEGRYGGVVEGAHTAGFNTGTFGVSLLGNYDTVDTPPAMLAAVTRIGAWAAERYGFDPRTTVTLTSAGSPRYPRGARITVPRMPGHRDFAATACPGRYAYGHLPALRADAWRLLRAHFGKPVVTGAPVHAPKPVTVTAPLDHAAWWEATITTDDGRVLAIVRGRSAEAKVSWNGTMPNGLPALPFDDFRWTLTADDHLHGASDPLSGTFEGGMPSVL